MGVLCVMARGARVGRSRRRARARAKKTTPSRTSLSLLPQPPSSASTDAPQPMFLCHLDAVMGSVRAVAVFRSATAVRLMSAACYSPRLLLRGLVGGARTISSGSYKGQPRQNTQDGFPLARPREELLCLLFGSVRERDGSICVASILQAASFRFDVRKS